MLANGPHTHFHLLHSPSISDVRNYYVPHFRRTCVDERPAASPALRALVMAVVTLCYCKGISRTNRREEEKTLILTLM